MIDGACEPNHQNTTKIIVIGVDQQPNSNLIYTCDLLVASDFGCGFALLQDGRLGR